ncbi:AIR carboxylase family protein [Legionella hackeliae]|uniref:Putative Phosphoribosylaminoimidazole carboxylase n=1 Tax=Legionella hackeliae TaxID=449 RepID=A0A0A8UM07_LEGHA|nr:phosphoribosylformylglycinamidine synthase II (FGAM synthase II) [Legionella hackeliae]CEK09773.1 putative Phosphoribosylaminoimidazole carboxylase [Legionella hackeliae]STX49681.1 phosphoribosylformylglycinamidine synthase II (FGAM synthase II) [Legionella hackeliae]
MHETPEYFDFSQLSSEEIARLLDTYNIRLTTNEALTIQNKLLERPPTYAECVLWSIHGSEHCSYKSSRKHLSRFNTKAPQVILGPKEDAGIVAVATDKQGKRYGIFISHESHNHPSQLVPYEGAATGVGGNVRDVCCMGAEVIAVADSLRFGDINRAKTKWIHDGVVRGIGGYANPLGIPNLAGDTYYDEGYNENGLVTVVTLGVVREDQIIHSYAPPNATNYKFILIGKPTDNSGFGGAAFASSTLGEEQERNKGAVQEPNAFLQRHVLKANYAFFELLRERNLIDQVGFKDLGAGGIACARVVAAKTLLPVLGVPMPSSTFTDGLDALLSIVQMPAGNPVGTLAVGKAGAINAAIFAATILGNQYPEYRTAVQKYRAKQAQKVLENSEIKG